MIIPINSPCISIAYWPMTFELLAMVPRDEPDEEPDLKRIFVDCWRSSTIIVSSGVAGRASGQMKLWKKFFFI